MLNLSQFSSEQRQAVLAGDGPLLIVAGPGSGKTTVLAARIAYLVAVRQISPASILAIAFATKAANELRARLKTILGGQGAAVDVTTFHAFGLRIVRQWSEELGFLPGPLHVASDAETGELLREVVDGLGFDLEHVPFPELVRQLERYRLAGLDVPAPSWLRTLATTYEQMLCRRRMVDYPAMLVLPLRLFSLRPGALRLYQDAYRHVLCDEFQDVCGSQYTLLRCLAARHQNLVAVGDPCQTLYSWRGADIRFLVDFWRDVPNARVTHLSQNFRSIGGIVDLANALGAGLPYSYPLWTDNPPGERPVLQFARDEQTEAAFIATEIERLGIDGRIRHPGEVAVLYRTNQQAQALALALRQRGLPYRVRGNGDLFSRREVRDVIAYLRLAYDPDDAVALTRIINVPPRRLARLVRPLRTHPVPAHELPALAAGYGKAVEASAERLVALITDLHEQSRTRPPATLIDALLVRTGYREWLARQADAPKRLAHLATLQTLAASATGGLGAWLADLQLSEDVTSTTDDAQRVVFTTIHGAKGGEWRVVFVAGAEEGLLPHTRSLGTTPQRVGIEEELRILYVAVTRPRERLYLTCCQTRQQGGHPEPRHLSRFLRDVSPDLLQRTA